MRRLPLHALLFVLLGWIAAGQEGTACDLDREKIEAAWQDVIQSADALGLEQGLIPELRLASRADLRLALYDENRPLMRRQLEDELLADQQADLVAEGYARLLLAKYSWSGEAVLVSLDNFAEQAAELAIPGLCSGETVRAILVHELVHAADRHDYGFDQVLLQLEDAEAVAAYNAVIEGHAQLVARAICTARGWGEGFATFESTIGGLPEVDRAEDDPGTALIQKIASATIKTSYVQGERFLTEVSEEAGPAGLRRAFVDPPDDQATVFHPAWFLHPEQRPAALFDLDAGLDAARARFPEEDWAANRISITPAQLTVALGNLPPAIVTRIQSMLRENRALVLAPRRPPAGRQVLLILYAFDAPAEARFFVEADERLTRDKDELMKKGAIRVEEAHYEPVDAEGIVGFFCTKRMSVQGLEQEIALVAGSQGPLAFELMFLEEPAERDDLVGLARVALARALEPLAPEPAPAPEPEPAKGDE